MRKFLTASAICALAVGLTVAPGAVAKTKTKSVTSTVTLSATPANTGTGGATANVSVSGNVQANSSCRKNRTVHLYYVVGGVEGAEVGTPVVTGPNGDFKATLPAPSPLTDSTSTLVRAKVDQTFRTKVIKGKNKGASKGKKNGKVKKTKFNCLAGTGDSNVFATSDGLP